MKNLIFILSALCVVMFGRAQGISKITLTGNGDVEAITFEPERNLMLNISPSGQIKSWGYDALKERGISTDNERLEKYQGNVEYYSEQDNEAFRGKIKYMGRTLLTYYAAYEGEALAGKLKSVDNVFIDYYDNFENEAYRGKIKNIGSNTVTWYSSFENETTRGKIKSMGTTRFEYYSFTSDKAYAGKIKSINNTPFNYYSSLDKTELRGRMKSGTNDLYFNGIRYYVRP